MGLIQAALGAAGGTLADQWLEFFYCEALPNDVLMRKGQHKVSGRSSNYKGNDNIISNGSGIAVADGQCAIIVEQGQVVDLCAVPGEYTYDTSTEPSIFSGPLGEGIINTFKTIGKRFKYGGDTGKDQRIYYFNTKEIIDNKFGTPNPIPFRVVDTRINLDIDVSVRCSGSYSFVVADPMIFYTKLAGNVSDEYNKSTLEAQLKAEFISALSPAVASLSALEIRPNQIQTHVNELRDAINKELEVLWFQNRGLKVQSIAMNTITLPKEDEDLIKNAQRAGMYMNANMAGAALVDAQAEAMKTAAANPNGAMMGFMGMGMAQNAGGVNAQQMFAMGQQQAQQQQQMQQAAPQAAPAADAWTCSCGTKATGKFCPNCGSPKPAPAIGADGWTCTCGTVNKGKFCSNCGTPKPAGAPTYKCDKCGWEPEDPKNPPKFCPQCGDPFNENDIVK